MKKISYLFTGLFLLFACKEKFLISPLTSNNLVVNGFFTYGDSSWFNISYLMNGLSNDSVQYCNNAIITITSPDGTNYPMHYFPNAFPNLTLTDNGYQSYPPEKGYYRLDKPLIYQPGLYKLDVEVPGKPMVSSYDSIPAPIDVKIESIGFNKDNAPIFNLNFGDPSGINNYYAVTCSSYQFRNNEAINDPRFEYSEIPNCPDNFIEATDDAKIYIFFSDKTFNGKSQNIELILNTGNSYSYLENKNGKLVIKHEIANIDSIVYTVNFYSISKAYFDYSLSNYKQNVASKDFYADPVTVYSNIQGGSGIFAGYSVSRITHSYTH